MFLKHLTLKDVRALKDLDLSFLTAERKIRKWSLLLGENGCGKSTILRAISLLFAGSESLPELIGDPDTWIRLGKRECIIKAEISNGNADRHIQLLIKRGDKVRDIFERNQNTLDFLDDKIDDSLGNYFTAGYGVTRRPITIKTLDPHSGKIMQTSRAQCVATMFSPDATLNPLESWAMDLDYQRAKQGLGIIKKSLSGLLPDVEFNRIDKKKRQLIFKTPDGLVPFNLLSDGYQNVAGWCGDLLYRITESFANSHTPLSVQGLLLIDEIDLHLHPVWKRKLISFLTEKLPNFQIVATTHSPLTAHQSGEKELFVLYRKDRNKWLTLYQYPGAAKDLLLHQLLLSPVFGLSTMDSTQVEEMRNEYKHLRSKQKKDLDSADKRRLKELIAELEDLPDWNAEYPMERQQITLLKKIQQALEKQATNIKPKA